jgi:signal transduction histidine kinase
MTRLGRTNRSALLSFAGWALCLAIVLAAQGLFAWWQLSGELREETINLDGVASQRADQHDAHLTSLSSLATAGAELRRDLFLDVASTIIRFYPRIEAVDLVPLDPSVVGVSTGADPSVATQEVIRAAARDSDGQLMMRPAAGRPGRYLLIKRSPNSDAARYGLSLVINADRLIDSDTPFWSRPSVSRTLSLPDGTPLIGETVDAAQVSVTLASVSQPLLLSAKISLSVSDLISPARLLATVGGVTALYLIALFGVRQVAEVRQARAQATLNAQETRLAHASRVNALGEMASGLAHEVTQPLTAILAQAQAGRHLAGRGDAEASGQAFDQIVTQARRASEIVVRLRDWARPVPDAMVAVDVSEVIDGVERLLRREAMQADIALRIDPAAGLSDVRADRVELEQIVFNLMRNAMEAVAGTPRREVAIEARQVGKQILIDVSDSGAGVAEDIKARLFDPFVSAKPGGTGLGLALCRRLAERMEGSVELVDGPDHTRFRLTLPALTTAPTGNAT